MLLSYYFLKIKQEEKKKPWCLSPGKEQLDTMPGPVQVSCAASPLSGAHTHFGGGFVATYVLLCENALCSFLGWS